MADFLTVVDKFPKSFLHFWSVFQTVFDAKFAIAVFFNAKNNYTAVAICKRGITLPKRIREAPLSTFAF